MEDIGVSLFPNHTKLFLWVLLNFTTYILRGKGQKQRSIKKKIKKEATPWQHWCWIWATGWPPAPESCSDFSDLFQFWQGGLFYSPAAECTNEARGKDSWALSSESLVETLCLSAGLIKWIFRYRECFIKALALQDRVILLLFPKWPSRHRMWFSSVFLGSP